MPFYGMVVRQKLGVAKIESSGMLLILNLFILMMVFSIESVFARILSLYYKFIAYFTWIYSLASNIPVVHVGCCLRQTHTHTNTLPFPFSNAFNRYLYYLYVYEIIEMIFSAIWNWHENVRTYFRSKNYIS